MVDTRLHLPDMFELTFQDAENTIIEQLRVRIGSPVEVHGGSADASSAECLIKGEVTSIEGEYQGSSVHTVIRGYETGLRSRRTCT